MSRRSSFGVRLTAVGGLCTLACMIAAAQPARATSAKAIIAEAHASLIAELHRLRPDITRFDATVIGHPLGRVPAGSTWLMPRHPLRGDTLASRLCVWVELRSAGHTATSIPVWFAVKAYRPVLVSTGHHWARDSIGTGDFTREVRDVAGLDERPLDTAASFAGMRTRRAIAPGHILMRSDIERIPEILSGEKVTVEVTDGPVAIQTEGVAMREARLGQTIELRNPTSHETYTARVVGQGRAAVEMPR